MAIRQKNLYPVILSKVVFNGGDNFKVLAFESLDKYYQDANIETSYFSNSPSITCLLKYNYDISESDQGLAFFIQTKKENDPTRGEQNIITSITKSFDTVSKQAKIDMIELLTKNNMFIKDAYDTLKTKKERESIIALQDAHKRNVDPMYHLESYCPLCNLKKELTLNEKIKILLKRDNVSELIINSLLSKDMTKDIDVYDVSPSASLKDCFIAENSLKKHNDTLNLPLLQEKSKNYQRKVIHQAILNSEQKDFENHQDFTFAANIIDHYLKLERGIRDNFNEQASMNILSDWIKKQDISNYNDDLTHKTLKTPARKDDFFTIVDYTKTGDEKIQLMTVTDYKQYKKRLSFIENKLVSNSTDFTDEDSFDYWIQNQVVTPTDEQISAIKEILNGNSLSLTGSAGTGKTQTTQLIIRAVKEFVKDTDIINLASTGEAANNMMSNFKIKNARTLHSYVYSADKLSRNTKSLIIVDESSMLDNEVIDLLLEKTKMLELAGKQIQFLFIGDVQQLTAVGKGSPFAEFVKYGNTIKLTQQFRQQNGSKILTVLNEMLDLSFNVHPTPTKQTINDLTYWKVNSTDTEVETIDFIKNNNITKQNLIDNDWKIVTPKNNIRNSLNIALQNELNPKSNENNKVFIKKGQATLPIHLGSPVVLLKNGFYVAFDDQFRKTAALGDVKIKEKCGNDTPEAQSIDGLHKKRGFNGQRGIISDIILESKTGKPLGFLVETKEIKTPLFFYINAFEMTKNVDLAFITSVHKAQGGQCDHVLIVDTESSNWSRTQNMIYTATSRTKSDAYLMTNVSNYNVIESNITSYMIHTRQ